MSIQDKGQQQRQQCLNIIGPLLQENCGLCTHSCHTPVTGFKDVPIPCSVTGLHLRYPLGHVVDTSLVCPVLQVSDSDLARTPALSDISHDGQDTILEHEPTTPLSEELPPATHSAGGKQSKAVDEVIQATKSLLDIIRLRDFRGYE